MVFPLPLTPFERYYLADDRREYPTSFPVEVCLTGRLGQEAFLAALGEAVGRHPLLGALVADAFFGPRWIDGPRQPPWTDWAEAPKPLSHPDGEYIDLRRTPGLRVWVRTSAARTRVVFQFHHACCDGLASTQFIDDVLILYALAVAGPGQAPALPAPAVERLRDRARIEVDTPKPSLGAIARNTLITMFVWARILFRRCAILAAPRVAGAASRPVTVSREHTEREMLAFEQYHLTVEEAEAYRRAAAWHGVTLNDLFVRDLILAVDDWNRSHGGASRAACRVNVPVNVRGREGADIPASNRLGFAFVTAEPLDLVDRGLLLDTVHRQMDRIKQWKLALHFLGGLALATLVPGMVPAILRWKRSFATIVLSNVGRLFALSRLPRREGKLVCGDVVLEHVTGVPPIRPNTRAALLVGEYAGATTISLRCDPRLFSADDSRALLETYVARLRETAAGG